MVKDTLFINRLRIAGYLSSVDGKIIASVKRYGNPHDIKSGGYRRHEVHHILCSLHRILTAVNRIEAFRYRIENGEVVCYDRIHASPTIGREDGSFGYGFFEYFSDLHEFIRAAERETERVKAADGLCLGAGAGRTDLIYFSAVPWFAFTEMKHARSANRGDSIPRISTGKLTRSGDRLTMPVSLDVHHGFIDGRQAGEFFALLENRE